MLKFSQKAVTGGCINFSVNTTEVCAKLPHTANDHGVIREITSKEKCSLQ